MLFELWGHTPSVQKGTRYALWMPLWASRDAYKAPVTLARYLPQGWVCGRLECAYTRPVGQGLVGAGWGWAVGLAKG